MTINLDYPYFIRISATGSMKELGPLEWRDVFEVSVFNERAIAEGTIGYLCESFEVPENKINDTVEHVKKKYTLRAMVGA